MSPESTSSPEPHVVGAPTDIILLAYNRLAHLARMVDAIEERTRAPYRLTIVDNGSEADVRAWLHDHRSRFHQVIFNRTNLHLAGLQVGIDRTTSDRYVVSDADLVPPALDADRCWLGELHALLDRHEDFGMVGSRIEGLPMPEWHRIGGPQTRVVDQEIIEGPTGVWLNMIRRQALVVPFQSDGMTCHALQRAGWRVGVGIELLCEHLGDADPEVFPDYLARKNAANGFRSVYVEYPELRNVRRPPTLVECAVAAPIFADIRERGTQLEAVVEVGKPGTLPVLSAVDPAVTGVSIGGGDVRDWQVATTDSHAPFDDQSVPTVVLLDFTDAADPRRDEAVRIAADTIIVLTSLHDFAAPEGFTLRERRPPNDAVLLMARWADRARYMRRILGYTTLERKVEWLQLFEHARFGARRLRLFECSRSAPVARAASVQVVCRSCNTALSGASCVCGQTRQRRGPRAYRAPFGRSALGAMGAKVTQIVRAVGVEWRTRTGR